MSSDFEKELIKRAIKSIEKCVHGQGGMETALVLMDLCKYIAGDDFEVSIERKEEQNNGN